jgi:hypothetical protein
LPEAGCVLLHLLEIPLWLRAQKAVHSGFTRASIDPGLFYPLYVMRRWVRLGRVCTPFNHHPCLSVSFAVKRDILADKKISGYWETWALVSAFCPFCLLVWNASPWLRSLLYLGAGFSLPLLGLRQPLQVATSYSRASAASDFVCASFWQVGERLRIGLSANGRDCQGLQTRFWFRLPSLLRFFVWN